jgi:nucleoside-diphosphate-sugar epimerase
VCYPLVFQKLKGAIVNNNISIFGGNGFIGSNFIKSYAGKIDLVDKENPNPIYPEVVYTIGTTHNYNIFTEPTLDIETNLMKLINDLEVIRRSHSKFSINYLSSWFVYGKLNALPFNTSANCDPRGFYSITKLAAEKMLITYCETFDLNYRILRLSNIYGPGDKGVSVRKNALQYMINQVKNNEDVKLYNGGNVTRDYLHVEDAVNAIGLIANSNIFREIINVGSGRETKILDVIIAAKKIFNSSSNIESIESPEFHKILQSDRACLEVSKLKSLGFIEKFDLFKEVANL